MRLISTLLLLASIGLFVQSCSKKKKEECAFLAPRLVFIDFTEPETDTIIIRRYASGTGFTQLIDTALVVDPNITHSIIGHDSIVLNTNNKMFNEQFYLNDWQLDFPGAGTHVNISEVKASFSKEEDNGSECHSFVTSMVLNGKLIKYTTWLPDFYKGYIQK